MGEDAPRASGTRNQRNSGLRRAIALGTAVGAAATLGVLVTPQVATAAAPAGLFDTFSRYPSGQKLIDGQTFGPWQVRYAGYGNVSITSAGRLRLSPAVAAAPEVTHAALVVSKAALSPACLRLDATLRTTRQLRAGSAPNPWETGWLIWDYADDAHFSYLALKTNGWELGKRDPAYPTGQRFLATGNTPASRVGKWRSVSVRRAAGSDRATATLTIVVDGKRLIRFTDSQRPYLAGRAGFYTEDAVADLDVIHARRC